MTSPIDLSNPGRKIHIGVILMNAETEILDVAPIDLFCGVSKKVDEYGDEFFPAELRKQALDIDFHWVNESGEVARLTAGLLAQPTDTFETCPPLDIAIMGAHSFGYEPTENELAFIRKSYDGCSAFFAVCGGFQAPLQAGIYQGKNVTAPAPMVDSIKGAYPDAQWTKRRWQRDGKLWTTGTLLSGLDAMRAFGEQTFGTEGTLMGHALDVGCWPTRAVDYSDVKT